MPYTTLSGDYTNMSIIYRSALVRLEYIHSPFHDIRSLVFAFIFYADKHTNIGYCFSLARTARTTQVSSFDNKLFTPLT